MRRASAFETKAVSKNLFLHSGRFLKDYIHHESFFNRLPTRSPLHRNRPIHIYNHILLFIYRKRVAYDAGDLVEECIPFAVADTGILEIVRSELVDMPPNPHLLEHGSILSVLLSNRWYILTFNIYNKNENSTKKERPRRILLFLNNHLLRTTLVDLSQQDHVYLQQPVLP